MAHSVKWWRNFEPADVLLAVALVVSIYPIAAAFIPAIR